MTAAEYRASLDRVQQWEHEVSFLRATAGSLRGVVKSIERRVTILEANIAAERAHAEAAK